jgi:RimJ/RimL family protein N-acetyltransferase
VSKSRKETLAQSGAGMTLANLLGGGATSAGPAIRRAPTPPAKPAVTEYRRPVVMPTLTLRPLERADAARLAEIVTPGLFGLDDVMTEFDPVAWVERKLTAEMLPICHVLVRDDRVIGYIQVAAIKGHTHHYLSLGGWMGRRFWGRGNSDQAIAGVQQVLTAERMPALYARMHRGNRPAHRATERAGFVPCPNPPDRPEPDFIWYRWDPPRQP